MNVDDTTPIRAESRGAARDVDTDTLRAYFLGGAYDEATVWRFVAELWRVCTATQLRISVVAGQIANETNRFRFGGAVGPEQFNLAGIGSTDDGAAGRRFASIEEGVRAVAAHHGGYLFGPAERWPAPWRELLPLAVRLPVVLRAGYGGTVATLGDYGAGRWATDPDYAAKVARHANALLAASDAPGATKGTTMALQIREAIIPATNANRPKLPMVPTFITVHETANPNRGANAEMHRKFLVNGGGPEGVSFHWVVDDKEAVHLIPDNEVAWHAGDGANGPGNRQSIAIETCVNIDGNTVRTTRHLIELVALLMARHGIPLANVVQHNHWSGKDCPRTIRQTGQWAGIKAAVSLASRPPAPAIESPFIRALRALLRTA